MKKMLVTGASGFLGSRVAKYFKDKYELCTPSHREMDITQAEAVERVMEAFRDNPRDMTMRQECVNGLGICFPDTMEALVRNFAKHKKP